MYLIFYNKKSIDEFNFFLQTLYSNKKYIIPTVIMRTEH